jgi:hypothetical protein
MDDFEENFKHLIQEIHKLDLSISPSDENSVISMLKTFQPWFFGFTKVVPSFERMTINRTLPNNNGETIHELKYLKNPPPESISKYGRANLKGQSILYATFILPTIIFEMKPKVGELVTISKWELKIPETNLLVCPIIDYPNCRDYQLLNEFEKALKTCPKGFQDIIINDYNLIAQCFSKYVEKGKDINYIFSAHFADQIFNELYDGKIEAIIYPSVQDPVNSANIALKPSAFEEKYKIFEICESIVYSNDGNSLFLKRIKTTRNVDPNGIIIWE